MIGVWLLGPPVFIALLLWLLGRKKQIVHASMNLSTELENLVTPRARGEYVLQITPNQEWAREWIGGQ